MANQLILTNDKYRVPPADVERHLRDSFPDCFLEWMPKIGRWAVKRRVPWEEVSQLIEQKKLSEGDVDAHRLDRWAEGHEDAGSHLIVHAFTVQDPNNGDPVEPGTWLVEAMKRADTRNPNAHPGGVRGAVKELLARRRAEEDELDRLYKSQIDDAVEDRDYLFRQLPRMFYPEQFPNGGQNGSDSAGTTP